MGRSRNGSAAKAAQVLIVDDHPVVREGLNALISAQPDLAVCGQAAGCADALKLAETALPDLIIVDISLKDGNGNELIKRIKARDASVRFLVSSMHDEGVYAESALRAGAMGFIGEQESTQRMIDAIRRVLEDKIYLTERTSERLLRGLVAGTRERSSVETLADRELQVLELIG
jgi:DNA-binding NarL/FixJ family response regulator